MDEIFESERLEAQLENATSEDPRTQIAQRVAMLAASGGPAPARLLEAARERANPTRGAFGYAARRTAFVAAAMMMLGGATVAVAAHDAKPGSLLHPVRRAGHAVISLFSEDDGATDAPAQPNDVDPGSQPGRPPSPTLGPDPDSTTNADRDGKGSTGRPATQPTAGGKDGPGDSKDDRDRGRGNDDRPDKGKRNGGKGNGKGHGKGNDKGNSGERSHGEGDGKANDKANGKANGGGNKNGNSNSNGNGKVDREPRTDHHRGHGADRPTKRGNRGAGSPERVEQSGKERGKSGSSPKDRNGGRGGGHGKNGNRG